MNQQNQSDPKKQQGIAALPIVGVLMLFIVAIGIGIAAYTFNENATSQSYSRSNTAVAYAKTGASDALEKIARDKNYTCSTDDCYSIDLAASGCTTGEACAKVSVKKCTGFCAAVNYPTADGTYSVVAADFNNDGKVDLATANTNADNISILNGNGDGTFNVSGTTNTVGDAPRDIVSADFNNDGKVDLATGNATSENISILIGNGDSTFASAVNLAAPDPPHHINVADFNGDGKIDLAMTSEDAARVSIRLGTGTGTFGLVNYFTVSGQVYSVTSGDFNRDGKIDIATAGAGLDLISILIGNGDGTFVVPAPTYAVSDAPQSVTSGDFNRDGKLDLVAAAHSSIVQGPGEASVLIGNGNGTFIVPGNSYAVAVQTVLTAVRSADFNRDGKLDLAVAGGASSDISILYGVGDGTFGSPTSYVVPDYPRSIALADFNRDGKIDIATANPTSGNVSILLNSPNQITSKGVVSNIVRKLQVNVETDAKDEGKILSTAWFEL